MGAAVRFVVRAGRPRPARARVPPAPAGGPRAHRPPSLPRPPAARDRGHPADPAWNREVPSPPIDGGAARLARGGRPARIGRRGGPAGMTTRTDFDRVVADWLAGAAGAGAPDYLDETLDRVSSVRQRLWWSSPERWLPMIVSARTAAWIPAPRLGRIILVAVVVLGLVGLALFAAGSPHRVPPPFGPARNGILSFSMSGDLYALDSIDATPRALIGGKRLDFAPSFSRDGTRLSFLRGSCENGGTVRLMAA